MKERVKAKALALGFTSVGIAAAGALEEEGERLARWLELGYDASMGWMAESAPKRGDVRRILPGARSVIAVALNYYTDGRHETGPGQRENLPVRVGGRLP